MTTEAQLELKDCPYCSEKILATAKKCKHCGEIIDPVLRELEFMKTQQNKNLIINNNNNNNNPAVLVVGKKNFNHWLHFLITLFTFGWWFPIWILVYIFRNKNIYN